MLSWGEELWELAAQTSVSILISYLVAKLCQVSLLPSGRQDRPPHPHPFFGQPPEKLGHWNCGLIFSSPGRSWGWVFYPLALYLARETGYGNCLPKPLSLCSLAPRQLDFSRSCQHSEAGKTEPIPLNRPHRNWAFGPVDQFFFSQGKAES